MPKFKVNLVRVGYGFTTVEVKAPSQEEANEIALDDAGSQSYSENSSDYFVEDMPTFKDPVELSNTLSRAREDAEYSIKVMVKNVIKAFLRANPEVESVDENSWIELPTNIVFLDMEDGNLIEAIERISTGGQKVETFLHGDGTERDLDELTLEQIISVMKVLADMLNANSDHSKIEIN